MLAQPGGLAPPPGGDPGSATANILEEQFPRFVADHVICLRSKRSKKF